MKVSTISISNGSARELDQRAGLKFNRSLRRAVDHDFAVNNVSDVDHGGIGLEGISAGRAAPDDPRRLAVLAQGDDPARRLRTAADDHGGVTRAGIERNLLDIGNIEHRRIYCPA